MTQPQIVVVGLPELAAPLRAVGYLVVSEATPADTARAAKSLAESGGTYVVIAAGGDPAVSAWAGVQASSGRKVLMLRSDRLSIPDVPPWTEVLDLPATIDQVMGVFRAPARGGMVGTAVVRADGSIGAGDILDDAGGREREAEIVPLRRAPTAPRTVAPSAPPPPPAPAVAASGGGGGDVWEAVPEPAVEPAATNPAPEAAGGQSRGDDGTSARSGETPGPADDLNNLSEEPVLAEDPWADIDTADPPTPVVRQWEPDPPAQTAPPPPPPVPGPVPAPPPPAIPVPQPGPAAPAAQSDPWADLETPAPAPPPAPIPAPAPAPAPPALVSPPASDPWGAIDTPPPAPAPPPAPIPAPASAPPAPVSPPAPDPWGAIDTPPPAPTPATTATGPVPTSTPTPTPTDPWADLEAPAPAPAPAPAATDLWADLATPAPKPASERELASDLWESIDTQSPAPAPAPAPAATDPWAELATPTPPAPAPADDLEPSAGLTWGTDPPRPLASPEPAEPVGEYWDPFSAGQPPPTTNTPVTPARFESPAPPPVVDQGPVTFVPSSPAPAPADDPPDDYDPYSGAVDRNVRASRARLAPVIVSFAAKGGVSKSTTAIQIARRAALVGGLRVVLVDLSRGQGDVRHYLRVGQATLPSLYDAALSGNPIRAFSAPEAINAARKPGLPEVDFAVALAPSDTQGDPRFVTSEVYQGVIAAARERADLVVVDTQIVESHDTSGLIRDVVTPLLSSVGGWGIGLSDASNAGLQNLVRRFRSFDAAGVGPSRLMVAFSRIPYDSQIDEESVSGVVSRYAHYVGMVHVSDEISGAYEVGRFPSDPELDMVVDRVLARVTGIAAFDPDVERGKRHSKKRRGGKDPGGREPKRRGLFGRKG